MRWHAEVRLLSRNRGVTTTLEKLGSGLTTRMITSVWTRPRVDWYNFHLLEMCLYVVYCTQPRT